MTERILSALLLLTLAHQCSALSEGLSHLKCEPITVDLCQSFGYNFTTSGWNFAGHSYQSDAALEANTYRPLITYSCSKYLKFLICSVYVPMCDPKLSVGPIGPCRSLCESVQHSCRPVLENLNLQWPSAFNCSKFVDDSSSSRSQPTLCFNKAHLPKQTAPAPDTGPTVTPAAGDGSAGKGRPSWEARARDWRLMVDAGRVPPNCSHLRNGHLYAFINHTATCELTCGANDLFNDDDKHLAELWMGVLASMCGVSCLVTIGTFLIDRQRFRYPVRPVMIIALCYLCYSASYLLRLLAGREKTSCETEPISGQRLLTRRGLDNAYCAAVFLLQYFFSTASNGWFAILVLTWLLQSGLKWSREALSRRSCYFHFAAWSFAIGLTVYILIERRVEADELLGMCSVGQQQDSSGLLMWVIAPNSACLTAAAAFLLVGCVAMWRVRRIVRNDGQKTKKFDILMSKIGLFSAFYLLQGLFVLGVNVYVYIMRDLWHMPRSPYRPNVAVLLLREFASMTIGPAVVLWIWSGKTLASWRRCLLPRMPPADRKDTSCQQVQVAYSCGAQQHAASCTVKSKTDASGKQYFGVHELAMQQQWS